jgi:hypothetical protein
LAFNMITLYFSLQWWLVIWVVCHLWLFILGVWFVEVY